MQPDPSPNLDSLIFNPPAPVDSNLAAPNLDVGNPTALDPMIIDPALEPNTLTGGTSLGHVDIDPLRPSGVLPVNDTESAPVPVPVELPLAFKTPLCDQLIGDWVGLPLKQQVAGYKHDVEAMWDALNKSTDCRQRIYSHLILLKHQHDNLWRQLDLRNQPKCTSAEASAAPKLQKHGFLTNPESEVAYRKLIEEDDAKQAADAEKAACKEAHTFEIEGKRTLMIADETHTFGGTLQSFKTENQDWLCDLAASLRVLLVGKKAEIFERISLHFEVHPELKEILR